MLRLFPLLLSLLAQPATAEPMATVRTRYEAAAVRVEVVSEEQARLRAAHEVLARRIAELKAGDRAVLPGVSDGQLDPLLKEAHELADRLEAQDRRVAEAEKAENTERSRLVAAIDVALATESAELARPDADRRSAFERMKALVAERGRLLTPVAGESRRTIELPEVGEGTSPDELRALADEATDNAERVESQLTALEERLQALQTRRRVMRAAVAFERDAALFAEDERNRRLVRAEQPAVGVATPRAPTAGRGEEGGEGEPTVENDQAAPPSPPPAGEPGGGEFGEGADRDNDAPSDDTDGDGLAEAADPGFAPEPAPTGVVAPGPIDVEGAGSVVVETALDPALLADDVEALSPAAVSDQIRAIEQRRAMLKKTAAELEKRRTRLEKRAQDLESQ